MHPSAPTASKKRGTIQIIAELLIFLLLTAATAFLLRPLQADLTRRMTALRDSFIASAEKSIGRRIEYRSMGPSLFGSIDLRDVRVVGSDGQAVLSVGRLKIEYSLFELLNGSLLGSFRGLLLDRPQLRLDTARDADLVKRVSDLIKIDPSEQERPFSLPAGSRIRVRSGSFLVSTSDSRASLEGVALEIASRENRFSVSFRSEIDYRDGRLPAVVDRIKTAVSLSGDISEDFLRADFTLSFPRLETSAFSILKQTALVSFSDGVWDVRKAQDRVPFDFRLRYDPKRQSGGAQLAMENFAPSQSFALLGSWASHGPWLASRFSGRAEVSLLPAGALSYSFDFRASAPADVFLPRARVELRGEGDQSILRLRAASLKSPAGNVDFEGTVGLSPLRPEGTLRLSDLRLSNQAKASAVCRIASEGGGVAIFSDSVYIGAMRLDALDAFVKGERDVVSFSASALRFQESDENEASADVRLGRLKLEGAYTVGTPYLQASLSLDTFAAADILSIARPFLKGSQLPPQVDALAKNVSFTTEIFVTTDLKDVSFNVPRLVAAYRGDADAFAVMSLSGSKGRVECRDISVFWKGGTAGGSMSLDFADIDDIAFSAQASYRDMHYAVEGLLADRRNLSIRGDYGLTGNFILGDNGTGVSGSLSVDAVPIPYGDYRMFASAGLSFRYTSGSSWSASVQRFSLEESGAAFKRPVRLSFQAAADQNGASVENVSLDDTIGRLAGQGVFKWKNGFQSSSASFRLADQLGEERYEADLSLENDGARMRLYGAGIRGERFLNDKSKLRATGEVRARWKTWKDYEADFKVADIRAELNTDEYHFSGSGRISPDSLELENVKVAYKDGVAEASSISIDRLASEARLSASFRGSFAGREAETSFSAGLSFALFPDWSKALSALDRGSATIAVGKTRYGTLELVPFELRLVKDGSAISLDGGPQNSLRLRFAADGAFFAALSAPSPIRGNLTGTVKNGIIAARASNIYLDFASLWSVLNIPDVEFLGGIAAGTLTISGPLADPDFFGTASATGFRATVPAWVSEEVGPVSASVSFEGKEFSFGPVPVSVGGGGGKLSGRFRFDRWVPYEFVLAIDIAQNTPIPAKADVNGIKAAGLASGTLSIVNTFDNLGVSGRLEVESTVMTIDAVSLQASYSKPSVPLAVTVNLALETGKKVEFVWPSTDYPVLRGYSDIGDTLRIAYDGMTGKFTLQGDVNLRGGEVFYFMRSFYIREGSIKFNENQVRVDPRLTLRAELRDQNEEGQVTVSFIVDEARLSSFVPRFESTPALSQTEIFGLLGQNLVGSDTSTTSTQTRTAMLSATSDVLAQFNVVRVFERRARELLGFDMFSLRTQLIQNAFFGATGLTDPVDRKAGLGNYFDNTTVYMGKFLGSDVFVQGMLSLQRDENKSTDLLGGLTIAPEVAVEWKTPLFLLRWNFAPDWTNDKEKLFINDHSFTLTWRKSF